MKVKPFAEQGRFTQVHNLCFDQIMPRVSGSAWKVLCLIVRHTRGKQKKFDGFPYAGIKSGTGIKSDTTVAAALRELTEISMFGTPVLLKREGDKNGQTSHTATKYMLNPNFEIVLGRDEETPQQNAVHTPKSEASHAPKNGASKKVHASKNGASHTPKNGASSIQAKKEQRYEEEDRTEQRAQKVASSSSENEVVNEFSPPPETEVEHLVLQLCGASPNSERDRKQWPQVRALIREPDGAGSSPVTVEELRTFVADFEQTKGDCPWLSSFLTSWRRWYRRQSKQAAQAAQTQPQTEREKIYATKLEAARKRARDSRRSS